MILRFTVYGQPRPAGSKTAYVNKKTGKAIVTDANNNSRPWKQEVAVAGMQARQQAGTKLFEGPLRLEVVFVQVRPKGHCGTGRNSDKLKPGAPLYPTGRPDATKLLRGVEDALTSVVWKDDAQIVDQRVFKRYGSAACAAVTIIPLSNDALNGSMDVAVE